MGKHREHIDIVADVLKAAGHGACKTRIMYRANLSYSLLEKYLEVAVGSGFLQANSSNYELTDSGKEFLDRYSRYSDRHLSVEGSLKDLNVERERLLLQCRKP
jgi:predicted transcriptional regulator